MLFMPDIATDAELEAFYDWRDGNYCDPNIGEQQWETTEGENI
jgi:hypothetical protein